MRKSPLLLLLLVGLFAAWHLGQLTAQGPSKGGVAKQSPQLAHMVFFQLKDNSAEAKAKMVEACNKYLTRHEGTEYYSAGTRATEFDRGVNDQEYDIALHLVFRDKAAHDKYQEHPRHKQFIEENRENWQKVRVFDSYVKP